MTNPAWIVVLFVAVGGLVLLGMVPILAILWAIVWAILTSVF